MHLSGNRTDNSQSWDSCLFIVQVLLLIGLSVGGSLVMRKYRTSLAVGFFLGVVMIMSQTMLVLFAVFAGRASTSADDDEKPADRAFASFCFFLWIVYTAFAGKISCCTS